MTAVNRERGVALGEDIEVPGRGYDTKDVEAMTKALNAAEQGGGRKAFVFLVLAVAVAVAVWLISSR